MEEKLTLIRKRFNELNELLAMPETVKDFQVFKKLSKEHSDLGKIVPLIDELENLKEEIKANQELLKEADQELKELINLDNKDHEAKMTLLEEKIKKLLLPKDENDEKNVIMEIKGAAGGDEGNIFAGDLFRMYSRFAESKGLKIEIVDASPADMGGFSSISFFIEGNNAYSYFKYESGPHRVQRVPETESAGRIHTSTATVLALPERDEVEDDFDPSDVRVDTFCSSGPGGQSVNTTKSAIRLTHIPTGIIVSCQDGKSQHENKANAFKVLRARLYEKKLQEQELEAGKERLSKIGHGDRSEKIRTYNYPQNRVTDHRINFSIQQLDRVMEGKLDPIIEALNDFEEKKALSE